MTESSPDASIQARNAPASLTAVNAFSTESSPDVKTPFSEEASAIPETSEKPADDLTTEAEKGDTNKVEEVTTNEVEEAALNGAEESATKGAEESATKGAEESATNGAEETAASGAEELKKDDQEQINAAAMEATEPIVSVGDDNDNKERDSLNKPENQIYQADVENEGDGDGDNDSIIDIVSESEVNEAAKQLLSAKAPQINVNYKNETFLLLGEYDGDNAGERDSSKIICKDSADLHRGCHIIFGRLRLFLQNVNRPLDLLSRELKMEFPDLDLIMEEDNMYNKDITINDIVSIFKILKDNSIKKCEANVPTIITINVSTKPRFVSRYNSLVEMLTGDATFSNIRVFSNDESHPVVLDDGEQIENKDTEVIVMSSGDEKEESVVDQESNEASTTTTEQPLEKSFVNALRPESPGALKRKRDAEEQH
ncbi:LAFA_0D00386g1_1 [Lachancea sp. 'fantastica']|nr:LAFA_0D00386g1_1 [Lachancea sp. 'fantastica']